MRSRRPLWKPPKTIGFKIAAGYTALFALSFIALAVVAYLLLGGTLVRQDREKVAAEIDSLRSQYMAGGWTAFHETVEENNRFRKNNPFFTRVLASPDHAEQIFFPHHWNEFDLAALARLPGQSPGNWIHLPSRMGTDALEILTVSQPDGSLFQVGISTEDRLAVLGRFREAFLAISLPLILLAIAGGTLLSRRVLRPLRNLVDTVSSIAAGRLDARVPVSPADDELQALGLLFNRMIERINQLIQAMRGALDSVAHDLRTPMTRFRNQAEKALLADASPAACREALQDCLEESDRILRMLAMLMDISEAETGAMRLMRQRVDLVDLAEGVVDMYRYVADEKGIHLKTDFPVSACLAADGERLSQVLANLLDNAVKFTPPEGMIHVTIAVDTQTLRLCVADTGIGIPPEETDRIWQRLYRGTDAKHKGLGLGLSLVRAVVQAHRGRIRVTSTPGEGSTFEVELPLESHLD